jgi:pilus assembly protein CpaB
MATLLVFRSISASSRENQIATLPVVVAARDIAEGAAIQDADLRVEQWPEPVVPENAFSSQVRLSGRVSRVAIYAGEAVVPGRLAPEGAAPGLEAKITPGKRAMGVRINDVSGMNGMVQPNSRVDILLTTSDPSAPESRMTRTFMENMRVLAIGNEVTRSADGRVTPSSVVMIEVSPTESEMLAAATSRGTIQLVLRGFGEKAPTKAKDSEVVASMLRDPPAPKPKAAAPATRSPAPVPRAPEPIVAPTPAPVAKGPARPESLTVQVWRGVKKVDERLTKDSVKRDTIRP